MAINSKGLEVLWERFSSKGVRQGISVRQYFESNGVPYHVFEKWYKKKFQQSGIVDRKVKECARRGWMLTNLQWNLIEKLSAKIIYS